MSPADTALAFGRISGKWVSSTTSIVDTLSNDYLLQRNFNVSPIGPCVLADAPGCLQSLPFPLSIPTEFAAEVTGRYDMTFMVPIGVLETFHKLGISLKKSAFGPAIDVIKADAKRRYGDNFQSCAA